MSDTEEQIQEVRDTDGSVIERRTFVVKKNKVVLPAIVLVVLLVMAYFLTKPKDKTTVTDNSQPSVFVQDPNTPPVVYTPPTSTDNGKVLGVNTGRDEKTPSGTNPTSTSPAPKPVPVTKPVAPVTTAPKPTATPVTTPTNTMQTFIVRALNFQIQIPSTWGVKSQESNRGNVFVFFDGSKTFGSIEVITGAYPTLNDLQYELSVNPSITNMRSTTFNGYQALAYTDESGSSVVAFIIGDHSYFVRGANGLSAYTKYFKAI
jgi:hypothetical protein